MSGELKNLSSNSPLEKVENSPLRFLIRVWVGNDPSFLNSLSPDSPIPPKREIHFDSWDD